MQPCDCNLVPTNIIDNKSPSRFDIYFQVFNAEMSHLLANPFLVEDLKDIDIDELLPCIFKMRSVCRNFSNVCDAMNIDEFAKIIRHIQNGREFAKSFNIHNVCNGINLGFDNINNGLKTFNDLITINISMYDNFKWMLFGMCILECSWNRDSFKMLMYDCTRAIRLNILTYNEECNNFPKDMYQQQRIASRSQACIKSFELLIVMCQMDIIADKQNFFSNVDWIYEAMMLHGGEIDVYECGCELLFFVSKILRQKGGIDTILDKIASNQRRTRWNFESSDKFHEKIFREFKTEIALDDVEDTMSHTSFVLSLCSAFKHSRI